MGRIHSGRLRTYRPDAGADPSDVGRCVDGTSENLSKVPTGALLTVVESHTHTGGADPAVLNEKISESVALKWAADQQEILERLAEQEGQPNPESATGMGTVVHALQQAQVEALILNDAALSESGLFALDSEPWLATAREEALGATVLGKAPASAALLRAAALTDAGVLLVPHGSVPEGTEVAALLRWSTGPDVPSS